MSIPYRPDLKLIARQNRQTPTRAEEKMWYVVLANKKLGYKFLRQKPLGNFVVDFYCSKLKLVIEIDGDDHAEKIEYDKKRTIALNKYELKVVRYYNLDVLKNIQGVYDNMVEQIRLRERELNYPLRPLQ